MASGVFSGIDLDVEKAASQIQSILKEFPSSDGGKQLKAIFSCTYEHFYKNIWEGLANIDKEQAKLLQIHMVSRLKLDLNILCVALYRAFRRALYCKCFNGIELSQMKQAGLYAYWITTMHPIIIDEKPKNIDALPPKLEIGLQEINERFAFYVVSLFYKDEFGRKLSETSQYQTHFVHAIKYRSFTEDSMMLVTESLGEAN